MPVGKGPALLALTPKPEGGTGGQPEGGRGQEESQERSPTKPARQGKASRPGEARGRREREPGSAGAQGRKRPQGGEGARRPHPGKKGQQNRNSKNPCHLPNFTPFPSHRTHFHTPPRPRGRYWRDESGQSVGRIPYLAVECRGLYNDEKRK